MIEKYVEIPVKGIKKAPWNYRMEDPDMAVKLAKNIQRNGQIVNIIVRELETGDFEVINGNHRLDAMQEIGQEKAVCCNLGKITDAHAKRVAVETNETEFETDYAKLADLINDMTEEFDMSDLQETMPYSPEELEGYINMVDFDWTTFDEPPGDAIGSDKATITVSKATRARLANYTDRMKLQDIEAGINNLLDGTGE